MRKTLANGLWWLSCLPERARFEWSCQRVQETQQQLLAQILRENVASAYGREFGFEGLTSMEQFQEAVPVVSYEQVQDRLGELTAEPVLMYEPTGGSSSGSRLIPYTGSLRVQFQRGVAAWIGDLFWRRPQLMRGSAYWSITPTDPERDDLGFDHDGEYLGPLGRWVLKETLAVSPSVKNSMRFWVDTCEALLRAKDLRLMSVWSPSYLLLLADHLEQLAGHWSPQLWWPKLDTISCWTDAQAASQIGCLKERFPGIWIQPKGLLATEGLVTIPIDGQHPLSVRSHVFEFEEDGRFYGAWELELGRRYEVLLTTGGGLYRYRLGDRVEVNGFHRDCPCLRFLGRARVADRFGEKLHEEHVSAALAEVPGFSMLAFEEGAYVLFLDSATDSRDLEKYAERVERSLHQNFHYQYCQQLGQLERLRVFQIQGDGAQAYLRGCQSLGQRLGDIKPTSLHPYEGWSKLLPGRYAS